MRIQIKSAEKNLHLWFPTNWIFSRGVAWLAVRYGMEQSGMNLTGDQLCSLFAEFRRIKKKYGAWELVDVESSNGEQVKIIL